MESTKKSLISVTIVLLGCLVACGNPVPKQQTRIPQCQIDSVRVVISNIFWRWQCQEDEHADFYGIDNIEKNSIRLDSIMDVIDNNIEYDEFFLSMQKAAIYSLQKNYVAGFHTLQSINDSLIDSTYKHIICKHFEGMMAQNNNQLAQKDSIVWDIINTIQDIMPQETIDSIMNTRDANEICHSESYMYIMMYYYYLGQIYGKDSICTMLQKRYNDSINSFVWVIGPGDNDFMEFCGI